MQISRDIEVDPFYKLEPYDALEDKNCQKYLNSKGVHEHLWKQGLINRYNCILERKQDYKFQELMVMKQMKYQEEEYLKNKHYLPRINNNISLNKNIDFGNDSQTAHHFKQQYQSDKKKTGSSFQKGHRNYKLRPIHTEENDNS